MGHTPRSAPEGAAIGQVLLEKYRVDAILGQGGMGVVAKCTHLGLGEHVAIKMLRQDVMLDRDATERFMREAQLASRLKSEHVARVVDVGTFPDNNVPYMIMEFLDGHDLGDLVDDRGPLQAPFAAMLMLMAAEALAEAHSIGIVHRDVKPSNLFVTWRPDGSALVKVLDFGISKSPMGTDLKLTQTQSLLGTPAYMSPEQMRSARLVDSRTDIWSLGTVFYELLEGRRPFEAESFSEMCVKVAVDPPEPMVNTPPALQQIILRCLAKNPDQRYATMAELGRDLLPHVQDVHQASLLVERMQRILGRSRQSARGEWEGPSSSTGVTRAPIPLHDPASAPVLTPLPFARAMTPDPRAPENTLREESKPARAVSEMYAVSEPKKSKRWLAALAALVVGGVAVGTVIGMRGGADEPNATPTTPSVVAPNPSSITKEPAGSTTAAKVPDQKVLVDGQGSGSGSATPNNGSAVAAKTDEIEMGETPKPVVKANPNTQKPSAGNGRPTKPNPRVVGKQPPDKPPPVGEGSAKTVVTPPLPLPSKQCSIMDRLPSGDCPKSK